MKNGIVSAKLKKIFSLLTDAFWVFAEERDTMLLSDFSPQRFLRPLITQFRAENVIEILSCQPYQGGDRAAEEQAREPTGIRQLASK